jgi:hypothetical protein
MTTYRISAPNGKTYQIEGPPGATREQVIQAVLAQAPEAGQAPETTFLGQVGEAFKGVIPGAIGLVEQAAIGASALLPQEQERAAREAIAGVAGAAKAPFAPAPGYEGTVGRKFGEAAGSFIPFLGLGPLGLAGRAGAVGLGVGAGAGEARTRAETEGATEEQRAAATALGTIPGALEVFAPFRILKRIPEGEVLTAVDRVKRVALAGGEEAAQEAASGLAQNMIARGVYKPDQALIEGLGEQAAYGGAVGGLAQGLLDLALGRRARGAGAGEPAPPEGQTAIDVAKAQREQAKAEQEAARAAPTNTAQATIDETLTQSISEAYPKLTQAIEALKQQPATKERNEAIKALEAERGRRQREDAEQRIGGKRAAEGFLSAEEAAAAGVSPREEFDPTQARREEIARLRQQREDTLVNGKPPALKSPARRRFDELDARLLEIGGGRWTPPTAPTTPTAEAEEPKVRKAGAPATGLQPADIDTLGITKKQPIYRRMLGKDMHDPAQRDVVLADIESYLTKGLGSEESRAKLTEFKERFAEPTVPTATVAPSVVAAPEPAPEVPTAAPPVAAAPEPETPSAVRTEPETSGAGAPVAGEPSAGAAPAGAGEAEPSRVVPLEPDAGPSAAGEGQQPAAVTPAPEAQAPAKLTAAERADLVEQIERVSGRISQDEYDAFYAQHTDAEGERVKNKPESIKAAQDLIARYAPAELPARPTPGVVSPKLTDAVENGDAEGALRAVRETPEATPLDQEIAGRFAGLGRYLGLPKIEVAPQERVKGSGQYDPATDTITIADGQVDTHTVLHETTHSFVHKLIVANEQGLRNDAGYRDLKKLFDFLNNKYPTLSQEYGMSSVAEFASEAMSNPQFQKKLGMIRYQTRSAWTAFVQSVRKLLKLGAGDSSALVEAVASVDSLLRVGREYQTKGPETGAPTAAVQRGLVGEKEESTLKDKLDAKFGGNKAIGFRAKAMDNLAGVDYIFTKAYGNRIRDNRGDYNPVFLMSRALDAPRFAKEVQEFGTMRRDPTGLLSVDTLKYKDEDISYKQVLESIAAEAKARGVNPETFLKDIGESLAAHREYELMNDPQVEKDIEFFLTPEEAKAAEDAFQADAFIKGVSEKLDAIRFALIDTMVDSGRITAEKAKEWKEATGYIPFSRIDEFDNLMQRPDAPSNVKLAAFKQIKEFKGSKERQTENPVTRFSNLMNWMVNESMKADAVGTALSEMELLGYAEFVAKPDAVDNNKRGALVPTYIKGQRKTFYVPDPANLAAFVGAPTNNIPGFIKAAQKFSQFLRVGVTATPPFAIKQVLDDITRAYVHSGVKNPGAMLPRILLNFPRNWWNEIKGTQSAAVKELAKSGVVPAYDTIVGDNVRDILQETGLAPRSVGKAIMRIMEAGAKASDVSVREAIFNQTMKETGDKALAELRAREIINFSRRGTARTTDYLIRTIPFFNAYARSMDKLLLAAAGSPSAQRTIGATTGYARNLFYKRMGVLTAMGFAYALLMSDDEEYQNLPDHVRDRNWILPGGKELGFVPAMPIPAELSFFFKAIPERVVQYYKLQGTPEERDGMRVLKELMLSGVDIFSSPNITPQVLKPILENLVNYSFFLGRPLESQAQLALDPSERYGTGTSEALREVSKTMTDIATSTGIEALKVSPIMLENLVRGMFGMSAGIALSVADVMVNPTRTDRPLHQTLTAQLTGASAVMKDPVGMRFLDEIYNLDRSTEQVYNTYNRKLKSDPDDAEKYLKSNFGLYVARSEVRSTMEAIRELNAQARAIDKMTDLTPEERRLLINDLRTQQNDLARAVYRLRRQVAEEQRIMDASQ